jgi:hypothetical protein
MINDEWLTDTQGLTQSQALSKTVFIQAVRDIPLRFSA